ncbi:hypothetical protein A8709_29015 [Paenibacillus pectinilyticus]|uniref:Acyltransferase 3 domain-containing protein n=1 Tax=Paenibacillus pectinilyticus TaxID=512399 RepID=A0A1C0ZUW8_9BACL|nr:acyltransferase [Paenibacillus pectinilyticus]OCT11906.1 hypothetical protein A8709_29015 [Paenibacillus pectinilyticus]
MSPKPKLTEIDIVRAIAIFAVLLIHSTSGATQLPIGTASQTLFFILNKASLFTVPLFIWISGLVLFYSYYDRWEPGMTYVFWMKRLQKILIPYMLWSIFYYMYNQIMFHGTVHIDMFYLLKLLLSGNASYHLYYIVIIVQFYVLFPFIMTAVKRYSWLRQGLIPLGIGIQAAIYTCHHWIHPLPEYASLFVSYTATFCFGAFAGIYYPTLITWALRYKKWIGSMALLAGGAFVGMLLLQQSALADIENTWFELALLIYCLSVPLVFVPWARKLEATGSRFGAILSALGTASFGIYLVHPAILTLWDRMDVEPASGRLWLYDLHTLAALFIGLLGSWLLARGYASLMKKGSAR